MFFPWWLGRPVERGLWRGEQQPWGYSCPGVSRGPADPFPKIKDAGSCLEAGEFLLRNWYMLMGMLSHGCGEHSCPPPPPHTPVLPGSVLALNPQPTAHRGLSLP